MEVLKQGLKVKWWIREHPLKMPTVYNQETFILWHGKMIYTLNGVLPFVRGGDGIFPRTPKVFRCYKLEELRGYRSGRDLSLAEEPASSPRREPVVRSFCMHPWEVQGQERDSLQAREHSFYLRSRQSRLAKIPSFDYSFNKYLFNATIC